MFKIFKTKYFLTFLICHVLSLCCAINGGGYSRRVSNKYNFGWNENDNNGNYQGQGNYSPQNDGRIDVDSAIAVKKAFGLTKVLISPIVIPAIIFVGIVLLLFFAVVGSSAVVGGSLGRREPYRHTMLGKQLSNTAKMARDVLSSDECVERISCEVFRKAKGFQAENWIMSAMKLIPMKPNWINRISRSMESQSGCQEFHCPSVSTISRAMRILN